MLKLYLDLCVYNRPFDDQRQERILIETIEFLLILSRAIDKKITLVNSFILEEENSRNPFMNRKDKIRDFLEVATEYIDYSTDIEKRAKELEKYGIMGMDALHIACAEKANVDFFVTCDDSLIRKAKSASDLLRVKIISLMEFTVKEVFNL